MENAKTICLVAPVWVNTTPNILDYIFDAFKLRTKFGSTGWISDCDAYVRTNPRATCEEFYVIDDSMSEEWRGYCESRVRIATGFGPITARRHVLTVDFNNPTKAKDAIIDMLETAEREDKTYYE